MRIAIPRYPWSLPGAVATAVVIGSITNCAGSMSLEPVRLDIIWNVPVDSLGAVPGESFWRGKPLIVKNFVVVQTGPAIVALEKETGALVWTRSLTQNIELSASDLLLEERRILAVVPERVIAVDLAGNLLWSRDLPSADPVSAPAVAGGMLFLGTRDGRVVALSTADGRTLWDRSLRVDENRLFVGGVAVRRDTLFVNAERHLSPTGHLASGVLMALDATSGTELWRYETSTLTQRNAFYGAPVVGDSLIIVSDAFGSRLVAIHRLEQRVMWELKGEPTSYGPRESAVLRGDTVFAGFADRYIYAADRRTGRLLWKTMTAASVKSVEVCGRYVLGNNQAVEVLGIDGRRHQSLLTTDEESDENWGITTSKFAVTDSMAIIAGTRYVTAIRC